MESSVRIRELINRLARLDGAETWELELNPAQVAALDYLSRANRFSRAPSQVAEYLGTTRGTMSQTLKALERKGYVKEERSETDKRSISYDLTTAGQSAVSRPSAIGDAIKDLPSDAQMALQDALSSNLLLRLAERGGRPFGICEACAHHQKTANGAYCKLLSVSLAPEESKQICHEQVAA